MDEFPPGVWDLDDYDTFYDWSQELRLLQPTRLLREASLTLVSYVARLQFAITPEDFEDEASDDGDDYVSTAPAAAQGSGSIRVRPVGAAKKPEYVTNDPKVSTGFPLSPSIP